MVFNARIHTHIINIGQKVMEDRKPFQFKWTLFFYNCILLLVYTTKAGYSYMCQPVRYSTDENETNIAKALWWFYFSKLVEMLDTIFFVLRKKNGQISFLHVYHHASMFPIWWIGVKWVAGGQSLGPEYQKYLWWKRYLTIMQLTQFFIGMVYAFQSLYFDCDYPKWMQYTGLVYGVTIIALFLNFYIQAYVKNRRPAYTDRQVQFVIGILHAVQSLIFKCDFPEWMHWALVFYAFTILMLFLNFYFHAYIKSMRQKSAAKKEPENKKFYPQHF
ncbi:hypothetical protein KUTeg_023378 [Tegillarca granosa]|uniref:Elongation of very long chain fatty acids protein n=1 Tax=Tegillarca granosa TaxID=220873 RepID=A0ABQ9E1H2_TEGGR|nr:hypothetical protein KUTeg_023378 [Tegillarca granosa]